MNASSIGPATVVPKGGTYNKGAKLTAAKLTFLGMSPNATVKLYRFDNGKFTEFDTMTGATITESERSNKMVIAGFSAQAKEIVGGGEEDWQATWEVVITGCADCS